MDNLTENTVHEDRFLDSPRCSNEIELRTNLGTQNAAVVVRKAFKSYGMVQVLEDFNMTVPKGGIYGLLGASGCGKTALLECLIGRKSLNEGDVEILGQKLHQRHDNECRIGYMPQKIGLYDDLSVEETFLFFGRSLDMSESKIKERTKYLIDLMDLPQGDIRVGNMSGGQQRRVSLSVTFLHEPELLILDEPTVGVDPVLRQLIWDHFTTIVNNSPVTIIITTHYIEEVLHANTIGIMRHGCLIAEQNPKELLRKHQVPSVEKLFFKLGVLQNQNQIQTTRKSSKLPTFKKMEKSNPSWRLRKCHMKALIWRNFLWFSKNLGTFLTMLIIPIFGLTFFCYAIGHRPSNFKISVANLETDSENCNATVLQCDSEELSCFFLKYLSEKHLAMTFYSNEDDSIRSVQKGESYVSITIKSNYSSSLRARVSNWRYLSPSNTEHSTIDIFRDLSDKYIALYTQVMLYETLESFLYSLAVTCGIDKDAIKIPYRMETMYGAVNDDYTDLSIPGNLLLGVLNMAVLSTALSMYVERNEASFERIFVIGITKFELVLSHIIAETVALIPQIILNMVFAFLVFDMRMEGSWLLSTILLFLAGFCGICYGMLVSCIFSSLNAISLVTTGTYFVLLFTSGIMWPIEGLHWLLKPFSPFFPLTLPTESMRNIIHRNWEFSKPEVYLGFLSINIWALMFLLLTFVLIRFE